ncbi:uncharacterized protein LOC111058765 [Nilaparvata lugens]|uniref:uncharacterized protein LOC111058765 n=1 Tax=Nilaparvata lugens TaxID=108931 RepID=UPI00193E80CC|nr:uncharacterized protein LOC111058765 [Nilaparvata lugens]XP_039290228.1 uncharacterized protein LOC111058765 [Nilaparvata lugens]XP_039290229.1 uncharacterized protein LOC111058765 [Nilaparvata lugens]
MPVSRLTIVKFAELILAIVIAFLHNSTFEGAGTFQLYLLAATFGGFAIIVIGVFLGHITGNPVNRSVDLFFCVVGAILYIMAAYFSYQRFQGWTYDKSHANLGLTKSALSLIQGIVFIVDGFFTFKLE